MKRTGECFTQAGEHILDNPTMMDCDLIVVHGLPTGTGGDAAKVGQYPHAWLELVGADTVYDIVADVMVPRAYYYHVGQIEYTVEYTVEEYRKLILKHGTYGPFDPVLLERDAEIDKLMQEAG